MSTILAIEANRLNPQTGPRSVEGKAASSMNALKTGIYAESSIIRGENAGDLRQLTSEYYERFAPATPEERLLVDTLVHDEWLLRRFRRIDAALFEYQFKNYVHPDLATDPGRAFSNVSNTFARLQRRISETERSYLRVLKELEHLRQARHDAPQAADPRPAPQSAGAQPVSSLGFVPQPAPRPAPEAAPEPPPAPSGHRKVSM